MDLFAVWVRDVLEEHKVYERLTKREREVLSWVALGKTNAEIAVILWLAPSTVRKHLENVYVKLSVRTKGKARRRLNRIGKLHVAAKVTYMPSAGEATSKVRKIKLAKRRASPLR